MHSHGHYDHIGNMQTFPSDVDLVVGPGIKNAFMPGWPKREVALQESDFAGRNVMEMSFEGSELKIGGFRALDFYGDGSFYLLDAPGVSTPFDRGWQC
jgi:glyoxylase-like metal-dependent hydrolase (beta-lactamase superfamily II)